MKLTERIDLRDQQVATDIKLLATRIGDLTALTTTDKTNLVVALNEAVAAIGTAGASIDDTATNGATTVTWSADKIFDTIEAAKVAVKNDLIAGSPTALDTLNELAAALNNDPSFATTLANTLNNKVDFGAAQTLTAAQKLQACQNIGIGNPDTDFLQSYLTARGPI